MLLTFLVQLVLMVLVLLIVVPAATANGVRVRQGGFFRALLTLLLIAVLNTCLWFFVGIGTMGIAVLANFLLFGLIGVLVNGTAFYLAAAIMPEFLEVRSFGSACFAALIMSVSSFLINGLIVL